MRRALSTTATAAKGSGGAARSAAGRRGLVTHLTPVTMPTSTSSSASSSVARSATMRPSCGTSMADVMQGRSISTSSIAALPRSSMPRQAPAGPHTHSNGKTSSPEEKLPPPNVPPRRASGKGRSQQTTPAVGVQSSTPAAAAAKGRIGTAGKEKVPAVETAREQTQQQQQPQLANMASSRENAPVSQPNPFQGPPAALSRSQPKQASTTEAEAKAAVPSGPPKPTLKERAMKLYETAKYLFKFYLQGIKQIWKDRGMVSDLRARIKEREEKGLGGMRWIEAQMIQTHRANMRKLPLFVAILLILEEVLPLVVIYAPSLLPSTCVLPSQLTKMRSEEERRRANAVKTLANDENVRKIVDVLMKRDVNVQTQDQQGPQTDEVSTLKLASLDRNTLASIADIYALNHWARPKSLLVASIEKHMAYLRKDDILLRFTLESRGSKTFASREDEETSWATLRDSDWLWKACSKRGLRSSEASPAAMESNLIAWLQFGQSEQPPPSNLGLALLPLALYDGTVEELVKLEGEFSEEHKKGLRQRTAEVVESVVEEERRRLSEPVEDKVKQAAEGSKPSEKEKRP